MFSAPEWQERTLKAFGRNGRSPRMDFVLSSYEAKLHIQSRPRRRSGDQPTSTYLMTFAMGSVGLKLQTEAANTDDKGAKSNITDVS